MAGVTRVPPEAIKKAAEKLKRIGENLSKQEPTNFLSGDRKKKQKKTRTPHGKKAPK